MVWALAVSLGTGIGYDHPIQGLFDGGISSLWRLSKAGFLGVMGVSAIDRMTVTDGAMTTNPFCLSLSHQTGCIHQRLLHSKFFCLRIH